MRKVTLLVTAQIPDGVSIPEWRGYCKEAIQSSVGGLHPDDPLFDLKRNTVTVRPVSVFIKKHITVKV